MMRKFLSVLLIAGLLLWTVTPAYAQSRYGLQRVSASTTGIMLTTGTWVYGIKIFATSSNSYMGIYDVNTVAELQLVTDSDIEDEVGEASAYESNETMYTRPIYLSDGVGVIVKSGVAFVYYGPQP